MTRPTVLCDQFSSLTDSLYPTVTPESSSRNLHQTHSPTHTHKGQYEVERVLFENIVPGKLLDLATRCL